MIPQRIQLRRSKGWRKPDGAIVVARPGRWGNPFTIAGALEMGWADDEAGARKFAVECFRSWLLGNELGEWWFENGRSQHTWLVKHVHDLYGKDLACWCRLDDPCHADVLLELANPHITIWGAS